MSHLSGILPRAQSMGSVRLRRPLRTGMLVALLLVLAAGVGLGVRGPFTPIAHAEPIVCLNRTIAEANNEIDGSNSSIEIDLLASYRSSDGSYCGHTWAHANVYLSSGEGGGTLNVYLYDCANHLKTHNSLSTGGGGDPAVGGQDYNVTTSKPYLECAWARANFVRSGVNHVVSTIAHNVN